jgi:hypothetical protein
MALPTDAKRSQRLIVIGVAVIAVLAIVYAALVVKGDSAPAGGTLEPLGGPDPGMGYVHGLAVDPSDGTLYAAARTGVFRVSAQGDASRIANRDQDTTALAIAGPGVLLASGHPDRREDLPDDLGLVESTDRGQTWTSWSLGGTAAFRALDYSHGKIFGYEANSARFMVSTDKKSWDQRAVITLADFAIDPADETVVVATTDTGIARSTDGGRTFARLTGAPPSTQFVSWPATGALFGATTDGAIHVSADNGRTWQARGKLDGKPQALTATDASTVYAATATGIHISRDGGRTFEPLVQN